MEIRVALDTNRLTDVFSGDPVLEEWLETCDEVWIPVVVLGEIKAGFYGGSQQLRNDALLRRFLSKATIAVLLPDADTADHYARLYVQLKHAGTPIPVNDMWIASLALQHNLMLVTRDRHFDCIPQLLRG